ncbi:MAG: hypothetical protein JWQ10_2602 [Herbaspirillum sp.]|nr:hypothetical protein [Herbaspirillum sp.]
MPTKTLVLADRSSMLKTILIALTLLTPLLIYWNTLQSIIAIWNRSETFTHQYFILPISLWLIWRRRETLAQMTPAPFPFALLLLMLCSLAWLLADLADVQIVRQYAFVAIIISAAVALLGKRISWTIAFPLAFLLLMVPFGEIFINPLIEFTANFTVGALRMSGIPVLREGNAFVIPSGSWSVEEACSGVRYLIASVTLGCLYAHLSYRSRLRQAAFILMSIAIPIVANGLRAYMIVIIGHLSDMRLAVGVDHLVYGWLFFGLVTFIMFWIGGFWTENITPATLAATPAATPPSFLAAPGQPASARKFMLFAACTIACIGIWPAYDLYMYRSEAEDATPATLTRLHSDWQDSDAFSTWQPSFYPAGAELYRFFRQGSQQVGLTIYYYRNQHQGATLISSANRILPEKNSPWNTLSTTVRTESLSGRQLALREETIQSASGPLLIWHWYWMNGQFIENDYIAKLLQAKSKLTMHGDDGAAIFVFARYTDNPEEARRTLRAFLESNLAHVKATLDSNRKQ